jgi:hypothetical protein
MKKVILSLFLCTAFLVTTTELEAQVGINNDGSAPHNSAMLDVKSTNKGLLIPRMTTAERITLASSATAGLIVFDTDVSRYFYYDGSSWQEGSTGNLWLTGGAKVYLHDAADSVGIGTVNPQAKLHVVDPNSENVKVYITPMAAGSGDSASIYLSEDNDATYAMYWMYDGFTDELGLWGKSGNTRYGPHMLIHRSSGNVALGNTFATNYKLSVNGKIICTEMRVNLVANWPDYVFKDGYKLMPLAKLSEFVSQNGHLPNVPSAGDIEKSGMDVGEMQRLMMEKIEELSLYIIDQQKQIQELKDRLDQQAVK